MMIYVGIDPGAQGALAALDHLGHVIAAHRYRPKRPESSYNILLLVKGMVLDIREIIVYLENSRIFPREEKGFITQGQSLYTYLGIWEGFLIAAGLNFTLIDPAAWQSATGLYQWRKRWTANPGAPTITSAAQRLWPGIDYHQRPDDGIAAALHMAHLAMIDHRQGIDRAALSAQAKAKKAERRRKRRLKTHESSQVKRLTGDVTQ
jgi:hypothetical protein